MIIKIYSELPEYNIMNSIKIDGEIISLTFWLNKGDRSQNQLGNIAIQTKNFHLNNVFWRNENLQLFENTIVYIEDKKFIINDENDAINLYNFMSGQDFNKFVKDFKEESKVNKIGKDF